MRNASNADEFKMRVSGILSTEEALDDEGLAQMSKAEPPTEEFESAKVRL